MKIFQTCMRLLTCALLISSCRHHTASTITITPKEVKFSRATWVCKPDKDSLIHLCFLSGFSADSVVISLQDSVVYSGRISTNQSTGSSTRVSVSPHNKQLKVSLNNQVYIIQYDTDFCYYYIDKKKNELKVVRSKQFSGPFL